MCGHVVGRIDDDVGLAKKIAPHRPSMWGYGRQSILLIYIFFRTAHLFFHDDFPDVCVIAVNDPEDVQAIGKTA